MECSGSAAIAITALTIAGATMTVSAVFLVRLAKWKLESIDRGLRTVERMLQEFSARDCRP